MKKIFFFILTAALAISGCSQSASSDTTNVKPEENQSLTAPKVNLPDSLIIPHKIFTLTDAEKILGEAAHLTDSSSKNNGEVTTYGCAYKANSADPKTAKTGTVYFLFEQYPGVSPAHEKYAYIKKANEGHEGINVLEGIGDEAYFHSDGENFYFIMARKGTRVFNMKVNKITSNTSRDEFNRIAKNISESL